MLDGHSLYYEAKGWGERILEIVCMHVCSAVSNSATPWTLAHQVPPFRRFPRQEYWNGWPFPSPGDLPDPEIEPTSLALADGFFTTEPPGKPFLQSINVPKSLTVSINCFLLQRWPSDLIRHRDEFSIAV